MAKKAAGKTTVAPEARKVLKIEPTAGVSGDELLARLTLRPDVQAGYLIQTFSGDSLDVTAAVEELAGQVAAVNSGDLRRPDLHSAHRRSDFHAISAGAAEISGCEAVRRQ
jgi:hypothetical protein